MKFYLDDDSSIYLYKLVYLSNLIKDYSIIKKEIEHGRIYVNNESVVNQHNLIKIGDEIRYRKAHIKVVSFSKKEEYEKSTSENIKHGKINIWNLKVDSQKEKMEKEIKKNAKKLHKIFLTKKLTLSFAESCTGGLLQEIVTSIPGASQYFLGGVVSYSNQFKTNVLNVSSKILDNYGAVSSETSQSMMNGLKKMFQTDVSVSITGIAGPEGGTIEKPIGTVFVTIGLKNFAKTYNYNLTGNRDAIRKKTALNVLIELINLIEHYK